MPAKYETAVTTIGDREILVTRTFDAPRELVFEMFTDQKHLVHWWGPRGFTTTYKTSDVRSGGESRFTMHGPDGRDYINRIVYKEVVRPKRLIYSHYGDSDVVAFEVTTNIADEGGKTKVTMHMLLPSAEERAKVIKEYGALEGANQTMQRLAEHLEHLWSGTMLTMERVFNAPREVVFKAWTDASILQRWWGPRGFTNPTCKIDPKAGGEMYIDMKGPDGVVYPMSGQFREVTPPERIAFTSSPLDDKGQPIFVVLTIVTLIQQGEKTNLTMQAIVTNAGANAEQYLAGMNEGWSQTLDRLGEEVES